MVAHARGRADAERLRLPGGHPDGRRPGAHHLHVEPRADQARGDRPAGTRTDDDRDALLLAAALCRRCRSARQAPRRRGRSRPARLRCEYAVESARHRRAGAPAVLAGREPRPRRAPDRVAGRWSRRLEGRLAADRGDLWDSGRVASDETAHIRYAGAALSSSQQVFWKVRVWDRDGRPSAWSAPATWTMGILTRGGVEGRLDCGAAATETLLLRQGFTVRAGPAPRGRARQRARPVRADAQRHEGRPGPALARAGPTTTARRSTTRTTSRRRFARADNAAGIFLGNGMYHVVRRNRFAKFTGSFGPLRADAAPAARIRRRLGRVRRHRHDVARARGPDHLLEHLRRRGPRRAARAAGLGHRRHSTTAAWSRGGAGHPARRRAARPQRRQPIRFARSRRARRRACGAFADGTAVYDFGQNASFMPRIRVRGPAGSTVRLTPAEVTSTRTARSSAARWARRRAAARGGSTRRRPTATRTWFPRFYYVGSRYLQARVLRARRRADDRDVRHGAGAGRRGTRRVCRGSSRSRRSSYTRRRRPSGTFAPSNPRLNRIRDLVRWAQRSNMVSVLTDCPHREKLGWIEQFHLNGPSIRYEFDMARHVHEGHARHGRGADRRRPRAEHRAGVHESSRTRSGARPNGARRSSWCRGSSTSSTATSDLLREHYDAMTRYVAYLDSRTRDGLLSDGLGDWYDFDLATPGRADLTPPVHHGDRLLLRSTSRTLAQIARVLGKDDDAGECDARRPRRSGPRYNREFFDATRRQPTAPARRRRIAIPLALGLADRRTAGTRRCSTRSCRDLEPARLRDGGRHRLPFGAAGAGVARAVGRDLPSDQPGREAGLRLPDQEGQRRRWPKRGTRTWACRRTTSSSARSSSGSTRTWRASRPDVSGPGFKAIVHPAQPVDGLTWAEATYDSVRGPISRALGAQGRSARR